MVMIKNNDMLKIILISKYLNGNVKRPHVIINHKFTKGITNEKIFFLAFKLDFFSGGRPEGSKCNLKLQRATWQQTLSQ
jgi:hypothetical protein